MIGRVVVRYDWQISRLYVQKNDHIYHAGTFFTSFSVISVSIFTAVKIISSYCAVSLILARVVCTRVH